MEGQLKQVSSFDDDVREKGSPHTKGQKPEETIDQMRWKPEIEWFARRTRTDRLMFCNEAGQSINVVGKPDWGIVDYLELICKVGMTKAAQISKSKAKELMDGFTRDAIIAQSCASHLGTLATRNSGELDFVEVSKWELKEMLETAYDRGWKDGVEDFDEVKKTCS